jgi:hypothetical protein
MLIIQTTFTGRGQIRPEWKDCQKEWIKNRIKIFKKYTLASLSNQTDKDFLHWISFRKEDKNNSDISELKKYLKSIEYNFCFTFNGQPYWDDRGDNSDLKQRLSEDLALLRGFIKENVYFTVLDSDDCFKANMVESIKNIKFRENYAIIVKKGYCLHENELYKWNPKTNPPFYTIMFPKDIFLDKKNNISYWNYFKSHEDIPKIFKTKLLPNYMYLTLMHSLNRSTKNPKNGIHPYIGKKVYDKEKILNNFGIKI